MAKQPTAAADGLDASVANRPEHGPVSRSVVLQCALRLVDRDGVDGLSMRRLSEAVGRDPTVIYRHIPNKAALLDGVAEIMLGQLRVDTVIGATHKERAPSPPTSSRACGPNALALRRWRPNR